MLTFFDFVQAYVVVTSMAAVWAVARTDRWHRWGYVAGVASEPAWLYIAITANPVQWGILLLTVWWTWYWTVGAWRRFGKNAA